MRMPGGLPHTVACAIGRPGTAARTILDRRRTPCSPSCSSSSCSSCSSAASATAAAVGGSEQPRLRVGPTLHGRRRGGAVPRRPGHRRAGQRLDGGPRAARRRSTAAVERELHACQVELITDVCAQRRRGGRARSRGLRRAVLGDRRRAARLRDPPGGRRGRRRDHRQGALRAHPRPARRRRRHAGRRAAHPRRHARRRDRDPRLQRPAPPPAAAAGARRQLAVPPRPRHRPGLGARGDDARLAALGRAARDARLRGLLRDGARCSPAPPTCPTTRGSGGSCARTRGSAPSRSARSTRRPRSRTPPALVALDALPGAPRGDGRAGAPDPPAEVLEEGAFRAARFGVAAELPDADGRLRPVAELLDEALEVGARRTRASSDCDDELDGVRGAVARGGGAGRQRARARDRRHGRAAARADRAHRRPGR